MTSLNEPEKKTEGGAPRLRLAAVQMVSGPDVAKNLAAARRWVGEAAEQGASLVLLPEYFPLMGHSDSDKLRAREPDGSGPLQDWLAATAADCGVWLVGGSLPLLADAADKVRNTCLVYGPDGKRAARYDKIHLFSFTQGSERYDEGASIEAGSAPVAFETPFARVGLSICYDLRFPELYRALGAVDLIVVPAAFTETTGRAHWETLLRARAIENQCYVLAAGQGGQHDNGRLTHGNSMLIDPWGTVLDRRLKGPGIIIGDFCPEHLAKIRRSLPALDHRVISRPA